MTYTRHLSPPADAAALSSSLDISRSPVVARKRPVEIPSSSISVTPALLGSPRVAGTRRRTGAATVPAVLPAKTSCETTALPTQTQHGDLTLSWSEDCPHSPCRVRTLPALA